MTERKLNASSLLKKERAISAGILASSLIATMLNSFGLTLIVPVLFQVFDQSGSAIVGSDLLKGILKYTSSILPLKTSVGLLIVVICLIVFKNTFVVLRAKLSGLLLEKHNVYIREVLLKHFLHKEIYYFNFKGNGFVANQLMGNVDKGARFGFDVIEIMGMSIQLLVYGGVLLYLSPKLTAFCVVFAMLIHLVVKRVAKKAKVLAREQSAKFGELAQLVHDLIQGIRVVKLSNREEDHIKIISDSGASIQKYEHRLTYIGQLNQPITEIGAIFLLSSLAMYLVYTKATAQNSTISLDQFFTFLLILGRALPIINSIAQRRTDAAAHLAALEEIQRVLADNSFQQHRHTGVSWPKHFSHITVKELSFTHPGAIQPTLENISLRIDHGEHIGIVGPSGSGKSTFVDVFLRLYEPSSGKIIIGQSDYLKIDMKDFRKKISLVPQETTLLFSDIAGNVSYFNPEATEAEIWKALKQADLDEFVAALPEGLRTRVGERGVRLSGGQRQRLAIARALLTNAEIIIFDEATSSLDSVSEEKIVESIQRASRGRTTITVAHRLSTIMSCDRIYFFENARIVEHGTPDALLKSSTRFKYFVETQNLNKKLVA